MTDNGQSDPIVICHFEDEPGRVDLPELLEGALYSSKNISDSEINFEAEREIYVIDFRRDETSGRIFYLVKPNEQEMQAALDDIGEHRRILNIVDMSIGGDRSAGGKIIRGLLESGFDPAQIWLLTAYPAEALLQSEHLALLLNLENLSFRILSKPTDALEIVDDIYELISLAA